MKTVTFRVLEGVDRGRVFRDMPAETPITIGREEGNILRLNDERVSRFHAKIQVDDGDVVLTDLESTNGTKVNGKTVQIRRLRPGDQILIGRSLVLFGSPEEIEARWASLTGITSPASEGKTSDPGLSKLPATLQANPAAAALEEDLDFEVNEKDKIVSSENAFLVGNHLLPPLPQKLTPAQAARIAEIFDLLHRGLTRATEFMEANEDGTQVKLTFGDWQKIIHLQMLLALYHRAVTEPDALNQ
jgi:pSer/pThr/pTyr-binding forkhead associated (FHA) protein